MACPSRKNYANICVCNNENFEETEILSSELSGLKCKKYFIPQREVADPNFDGLERVSFTLQQVFEALADERAHLKILWENKIADAKVLSKREYKKWNSQARI